ncbi:Metallo-dependent phosphatase-like protein [Haematococcus lacustris]
MGLLSWLLPQSSAEQAHQAKLCSTVMPEMMSSFVDSFVDAGFNGASCATAEEAGVTGDLPTVLPATSRLMAIGDLHGDLGKARRAFRLAGITDEQDRWAAGSSVCVQVGDILDRGDAELQILLFMERLQAEARAAGGALHVLNGNHETMNVMGNHRYATAGANREIERWQQWQRLRGRLQGLTQPSSPPGPSPQGQSPGPTPSSAAAHWERSQALQPGSAITRRFFANHPTVLQVGSTVFVHGGVLPEHVEYGLERINRETRQWMESGSTDTGLGPALQHPSTTSATLTAGSSSSVSKAKKAPNFLRGATAIVWARNFSTEDHGRCDCDVLRDVLQAIPGSQRMVMGHTIQDDGINAACDGRALRVDVGMSKGCGNSEVEVLELTKDGLQVRRLREGKPAELLLPARQAANEKLALAPHTGPFRSGLRAMIGMDAPATTQPAASAVAA